MCNRVDGVDVVRLFRFRPLAAFDCCVGALQTDTTVDRRLNEDLKSTVVNDQTIGDLMDAVKSLKADIEEMQKAELATKAELAALKDEIEEMKKDGLTTAEMK